MQLTKLSLFSGIGGDDLASDWAGIKTIAFCEKDKFCQQVLRKHWANIPIIEDVKDVKGQDFKQPINIISGGFPCQPFSQAGKRRGRDDDRYLWDEMFRIITEIKPTWIVGENVAGILTLGEQGSLSSMENQIPNQEPRELAIILDRICESLEKIGYEVQPIVLPACAVEAPHRRDRTFIVAYLQGMDVQFSCQTENNRELQGCDEHRGCFEQTWLQVAPTLCRVDDGFPTRLDKDRLHALGNAVVPQQIYPIYKAIVDIENQLEIPKEKIEQKGLKL